ncbi:MAG TPA: hypothetical protein VI318_17690 [Baekduia sp.]
MSFLIDPPWLYANGRALAAAAPDNARRDQLAGATLGVFLVTSISLYLDKAWTRPIWRLCRARSGRDWMLNSGVLRLDPERAGTPTHLVSGALFATYPFWLWLGLRHGRD